MFEMAPAILRRYHVGAYEIRVHCSTENFELLQGWLYKRNDLVDTILTVDKDKRSKLADWFLMAAE